MESYQMQAKKTSKVVRLWSLIQHLFSVGRREEHPMEVSSSTRIEIMAQSYSLHQANIAMMSSKNGQVCPMATFDSCTVRVPWEVPIHQRKRAGCKVALSHLNHATSPSCPAATQSTSKRLGCDYEREDDEHGSERARVGGINRCRERWEIVSNSHDER